MAGLVSVNVRGFNLTVPHKSAILPLLSEVAPEARFVGAVNTVRQEGGRLSATNTDGSGFLRSLRHDLDFDPAGREVLLLGAGGAGRGIAFALLEAGVGRLAIANRSAGRAVALAAECRSVHPGREVREVPWGELAGQSPHLLVNATTVGMGEGESPVELSTLSVRGAVLDIVYHPPRTALLEQAGRLGLPAANGLGMLLHQGVAALRFWTGAEPPVEAMRAALLEAMHG